MVEFGDGSLLIPWIPRNISRNFPAMVISETGNAISPFSIQKPPAPRIVTCYQINAMSHKFSDIQPVPIALKSSLCDACVAGIWPL